MNESQKCTSKGIRRQGAVLKPQEFLTKEPTPCYLCSYCYQHYWLHQQYQYLLSVLPYIIIICVSVCHARRAYFVQQAEWIMQKLYKHSGPGLATRLDGTRKDSGTFFCTREKVDWQAGLPEEEARSRGEWGASPANSYINVCIHIYIYIYIYIYIHIHTCIC